jgi:TetR/AcrR family transcriptional regulator, regulator of mycofactocin system
LHALRVALLDATAIEDPVLSRRWINVLVATPGLLPAVIGGIHLKSRQVIAEFFGARLGLPSVELLPTMLAAATGGVMEAAYTRWFVHGGDLVTTLSKSLEVLEWGVGATLGQAAAERPSVR